MHVPSGFRGLGIDQHLVAATFAQARANVDPRKVPDSHRSMTQAHIIYCKRGFDVVDAPADFLEELKLIVLSVVLAL